MCLILRQADYMIKYENLPLLKWKLVAVIETDIGPDTMFCVRTENGETKEPFTKLYKLPLI